jgi:hypothetical protein
MKIPVNFIGTAVILTLLSASIANTYNVQILPRLWDWSASNASVPGLGLTSIRNLKFVKHAVALFSEDMEQLGNAFTTHKEPITSTPKALPTAIDAAEQPAERTETLKANSEIAPPVTDNLNHPGTENPELVGAL